VKRSPLPTLSPSLAARNPHLAAPATKPRRPKRAASPAARRRSGAVAHARGDAFEAVLAPHHAVAAAEGIADVRKVGAPVVVGRRGKPIAWAGVGPADYVGTLRGGRALVVEAKSTATRLSLADIPEHQRAHLDACAALGGLALLAVELRGRGVYVVEWSAAPWRVTKRTVSKVERGRKVERVVESRTLGAEELAGHRAAEGCYLRRWAGGAK
jgi:penicillin-binding protein-related factor A (putative recombinase)